jgi:hypothetical protein
MKEINSDSNIRRKPGCTYRDGHWYPTMRSVRAIQAAQNRFARHQERLVHCDVCGMIPPGKHRDLCIIGVCERERASEKARLAVWRDDRGGKGFSRYGRLHDKDEYGTISTIVRCAEDVTTVVMSSAYDEYILTITHTDTFRGNRSGKGFTPTVYRTKHSVYHTSRWAATFETSPTWQEALEKGTADLKAMVERENQEWADFNAGQEKIKAEVAARGLNVKVQA